MGVASSNGLYWESETGLVGIFKGALVCGSPYPGREERGEGEGKGRGERGETLPAAGYKYLERGLYSDSSYDHTVIYLAHLIQ